MIKLKKKDRGIIIGMACLIKKCEFKGYKVEKEENGVYIGAILSHKKTAGLNVYDEAGKLLSKISFEESLFMGDVLSCTLCDFSLDNKRYRFEVDSKEIIDPYSRKIYGNNCFGKVISESDLYSALSNRKDPKGWDKDMQLRIPYSDAFMYVCHLRGLTMADESIKENKGTFKAATVKAKGLKKLGVTSVIFMPVYERIEHEKATVANNLSYKDKKNNMPINYWGFGPGYYYALKKSYAADEDVSYEFKNMVKTFHDNGLEVILTFDFCNLEYNLVSDILKFWIYEYHVDGFRIFGCSEYGRFINDPFLKNTKLIFERFFDELNDIKQVSYKNIAIIDKDFRNNVRKFLKSDDDLVGKMCDYIRENHNNYAVIRNITDFDGFTLKDLVSYDKKHNVANNEDEKDGTNYNYSWNCGVEGDTSKKSILKLRYKQIKNALLLISLCQGTPMINAGDEYLNSSSGNNNPYCQDNEIGWATYNKDKTSKAIYRYIKNLIEFRKNHHILHQPFELKGYDYLSCKMPDISFHSDEAWKVNNEPASREFSVLYGGDYAKQYVGEKEDSIFVAYNFYWDDKKFWMPLLPKEYEWVLVTSTADNSCDFLPSDIKNRDGDYVILEGRSISIFASSKKSS